MNRFLRFQRTLPLQATNMVTKFLLNAFSETWKLVNINLMSKVNFFWYFTLFFESDCFFFHLGNIIYAPFPKCFETDSPLTLKYGVDEIFNCTIDLGHEFFMYFSYIFTRMCHFVSYSFHKSQTQNPAPPADSPEAKAATLYTSLTFNIRGRVQESHLDIDPF